MTQRNEAIFANMIACQAEKLPDFDVLTFVTSATNGGFEEETRTYRQLWQNGQKIATALLRQNMESGDSFALLMQNHPEFVDAMVGSSIAGTTFVPIDPRTKGGKLAYMLNFAECRGVICADYALPALIEVLGELPDLKWIWVIASENALSTASTPNLPTAIEGIHWLADVLLDDAVVLLDDAVELAVAVTDPDQAMQMLYTSGTTGDPKAILASYSRFHAVASIGASVLGLNETDRPYTGLSLTHANAQLLTLGNVLKMGLRGVISRKFTKSRLWDICRAYGCTTFNLLGGMTTAIYSEPVKADDADNPVRFVLSAGMPAAIWKNFQARFDIDIFEFYGAAEGGLTFNFPGEGPVGSIGKPPPSMIAKIVDEDDSECPPNVHGEIVFRNADGSCPSVEYYQNPEASAKKTRGGWLRMGDIGHTDDDGYFYFDSRKGGGIRRNGDFINAAFVEKVIAEHSAIDDVFVYGVAASSGVPGEKDIVAAVVPSIGTEFNATSIFEDCREKLEVNFVPSFIQVMKEIPKTASEKPQERFCLEMFERNSENVFSEVNK